MPLQPGLYVAATPIGNLKDITYRAVEALKEADRILCEDTRQTAKLCAAYGITTPRSAYHDHNGDRVRPGLIKALQDGAAICLVSDAGTPLISDPGMKLVRDARAAGVRVTPLPGACAAITALSGAGFPSDRFLFAGFPPAKAAARERFFSALKNVDATLVFYESAGRLGASLQAMASAFGERTGVVARELTKKFETFDEASLPALADKYEAAPTKGEIVVLVSPGKEKAAPREDEVSAFLKSALQAMSVKDAANAAAEALGVPKKAAYEMALAIRNRPNNVDD